MRRVIAGDGVDCAVGDSLDDCGKVVGGSKGRIHFGIGVVIGDSRIRQGEMMRSHFGRDTQSTALGFPHSLERSPGAQMSHVIFAARHLGKNQVAAHHRFFRCGRDPFQAEPGGVDAFVHHAVLRKVKIFAVLDHGHIEHARILQGAPKQSSVHHGFPVIGDADDTRFEHFADFRQRLAFLLLRDGANRKDTGR